MLRFFVQTQNQKEAKERLKRAHKTHGKDAEESEYELKV